MSVLDHGTVTNTSDHVKVTNTPGKLAKVRAVLALGISATVSLEDVRFNTVLRAEVLLSSEVALPSIQNVRGRDQIYSYLYSYDE